MGRNISLREAMYELLSNENIKQVVFDYILPTYCVILYNTTGARVGLVGKSLRYKPAGRGFDSRCCHWNFSVT